MKKNNEERDYIYIHKWKGRDGCGGKRGVGAQGVEGRRSRPLYAHQILAPRQALTIRHTQRGLVCVCLLVKIQLLYYTFLPVVA